MPGIWPALPTEEPRRRDNHLLGCRCIGAFFSLLFLFFLVLPAFPMAGDLNGDRSVELSDAIIGLGILSGRNDLNLPSPAPLDDLNSDGRLGLSETIYILQKIANVRGYTKIAAGRSHTLALGGDGTVRSWGNNGFGQLGEGSASEVPERNIPGPVFDLTSIQAISAGALHSLALGKDGIVYSWGCNEDGQLGEGTSGANNYRDTPWPVGTLRSIREIDAGGYHSAALKSDGTVWTWGFNGDGQLGNGMTANQNLPVQTLFPPGVVITAIAAGEYHTVALDDDGGVWTWGFNEDGQLGTGTTVARNAPARVQFPPGVILTAIAAGGYHTVALAANGAVWAWGYNVDGELGIGNNVNKNSPQMVAVLTDIVAVSAGDYHTAALGSDGHVWTWGYNGRGALGDGTSADRNAPYRVGGLEGISSVAAGGGHTMALGRYGAVWTWGDNQFGQLGDGLTAGYRLLPATIGGP